MVVAYAYASSAMTMLHLQSLALPHQQTPSCEIRHLALQQQPRSISLIDRSYWVGLNLRESWQRSSSSSADSLKFTSVQKVERIVRWKVRMMSAGAGEGSVEGKPPLRVMISGAPASGKGTQCELIVETFGLSHISTGDLLRAEVAAESDSGKNAKTYMDAGLLVPNEIVVAMVEKKLAASDRGWLLDGYPRSLEQAEALEAISVRPQLFILLDVPDEVLVERVVGRRLDPVTRKIYHVKYSPPETDEIRSRLTHRIDDTEEKAGIRLATYHANVAAVIDVYKNIIKRVDGNRPKKDVFADIAQLLKELQDKEDRESSSNRLAAKQQAVNGSSSTGVTTTTVNKQQRRDAVVNESPVVTKTKEWTGVPTKLNTTPHSREIRQYFYADVCKAVQRAVEDGIHKLKVQLTIPELNPEMDVFRIGTLLEIIREIAFAFANDGKRVRVCVQGSMGEGIFSGMPLQLAGTRHLLDRMDWGEYGAKGNFINIGSVGAKEVSPDDDMFILIAPQNAAGNCIIDDLKAMVAAAGDRPVIIVNPRLKDLPGSGGVMQVRGREKRLEFVGSFFTCYHFRLLYQSATLYPILGAIRRAYPSLYQIYKRLDKDSKIKEEYVLLPDTFETEPNHLEIADAYYGRSSTKAPDGIWSFLNRILN
ncbi:unnamed protein product [Calypogeia fissa]